MSTRKQRVQRHAEAIARQVNARRIVVNSMLRTLVEHEPDARDLVAIERGLRNTLTALSVIDQNATQIAEEMK